MSGLSSEPASAPPDLAERIDRACDRFEASWRSGQAPRIETFLAEFDERERAELLRELVATELELRMAHGDCPDSAEYRKRFPADKALIDTIFCETTSGSTKRIVSDLASAGAHGTQGTEEIPLVGIMALQMGYVSREQLEAAMAACGTDAPSSLGPFLVERGFVQPDTLALIQGLIGKLLAGQGAAPITDVSERSNDQLSGDLSSLAADSTLWGLPNSARAETAGAAGLDFLLDPTVAGDPHAGVGKQEIPRVPGYELLGELGRGGMGVVYRARQLRLNRPCALKMILAGDYATAESTARFVAEARTIARLRHPNIVQIHAIGDHSGRPYLELEFVEGGTLAERIDGTPWTEAEAARFVRTLALAIHEAHRLGIVHRDLKPANVLLAADGTAKVTDFGLAKALSVDSGLTRTQSIVGSPSYMAPEQAVGKSKRVGVEADVYSLGAILYELITGRPPFKAATVLETLEQVRSADPVPPSRLRPRMARDLETICLKCLLKDPEKRYPTAEALADDLGRFGEGMPIRARPVRPVVHLARWCRRNPALTALGGVATLASAVAVAALVGFLIYQTHAASTLRNALKSVEAERRNADLNLTKLTFQRGQSLCEQGDVALGVLWLVRALEIAGRAEAPDLERVIRMGLTGWSDQLHPLRQYFDHRGTVLAIAYSPDGKTIATASEDKTVQLWNATTGAREGPPLQHSGPVDAVQFNPKGGQLLTAVHDGKAFVWDLGGQKRLLRAVPHPSIVTTATFNPDGTRITTAGEDGTICFWDAASLAQVGATLKAASPVRVLTFRTDGALLLTGSDDGTAQFWEVSSGKRLDPALREESAVRSVAISRDGKYALTSTSQGISRLWDVDTKQAGAPLRHGGAGDGRAAFSPDGTRAITWSHDWWVQVWEVPSCKPLGERLRQQGPISAAAFSPDGRLILTASRDGEARLWDAATSKPAGAPLRHAGMVLSALFSPDGKTVLTSGDHPTAQLWEVRSPQAKPHPFSSHAWLYAMAFSPDGRLLAASEEDGTTQVWDWATGQVVGAKLKQGDLARTVALVHGGKWLVAASDDGTIRMCDVQSGEPIGAGRIQAGSSEGVTFGLAGGVGQPHVQPDGAFSVAVSPDERTLLAGSAIGAVSLWDIATGKQIWQKRHHSAPVATAAFSPDGKRFLTGSADYTAQLWDSATHTPVAPPLRHEGQVWWVAFSPNGSVIATGGNDKTVRFWDAATGRALGAPLIDQDPIRYVRFGPAGDTVLVACWSDRTRLWDFATRQPIGPPLRQGGVMGMTLASWFAPRGDRFVIASEDKTVRESVRPSPMHGNAQEILLWAQVTTGMHLSAQDVSGLLDRAQWREAGRQLEEMRQRPSP
jgi:WD40 repeat protein